MIRFCRRVFLCQLLLQSIHSLSARIAALIRGYNTRRNRSIVHSSNLMFDFKMFLGLFEQVRAAPLRQNDAARSDRCRCSNTILWDLCCLLHCAKAFPFHNARPVCSLCEYANDALLPPVLPPDRSGRAAMPGRPSGARPAIPRPCLGHGPDPGSPARRPAIRRFVRIRPRRCDAAGQAPFANRPIGPAQGKA